MAIEKSLYVLVKKDYSYHNQVHGVTDDRDTAQRWVDWAEGDYIHISPNQGIFRDQALDTESELEAERKRREEERLKVTSEEREVVLNGVQPT